MKGMYVLVWGGRGINQDGGGGGVDGPEHDASPRKEGT